MKHSKLSIAYHEAGHIAAALRLQVPVKYATIISDDVRFDGRVIYPPSKHTPFVEAVILLAGCVAEARYLRKPIGSIVLNGSRSDLTQAAKALMSYSPPRLTLGYALEYTIELIAGEFYNNHVQTLAAALLREQKLSGDEIHAVVRDAQTGWNWASPRWD